MKHIKFVIFFLCGLFTFIIYKNTLVKNIDYLALGDSLSLGQTPFNSFNSSFTDYTKRHLENKYREISFSKDFCTEDYRITDLINDIKNNKEITKDGTKYTINQKIASAELITVSIGSEEIFYKIKTGNIKNVNKYYDYIDGMFEDIESLTELLQKYTNKPIIYIGYYSPLKNPSEETKNNLDNLFHYIELKYKNLQSRNKNIYYIDIYEEFNKTSYYLPSTKVLYPSLEGYNYISNRIIDLIETKNLLK